ncbi:hypothetical protein BX600DRAFT_270493 [Xylariales sp. PMI_506]|nr:hypothetical protein BX600DRAFT_270493 [Xylariales sp. PMI_506]
MRVTLLHLLSCLLIGKALLSICFTTCPTSFPFKMGRPKSHGIFFFSVRLLVELHAAVQTLFGRIKLLSKLMSSERMAIRGGC